MLLVKFIVITILSRLSSAYRVLLLFPIPCRSHAMLGEGYVRHLLDSGHEVTYITAIRSENFHPRLRQIDISSNNALMPVEELVNITEIINTGDNFDVVSQNLYTLADFAYSTLMHPNVQRIIQDTSEQFDVVIAGWFFSELYTGLSTVFNCPLIWSCSMEPHSLALELIDDVLNPAYNPNYRSDIVPPYSFTKRVKELLSMVVLKFHKWWLRSLEHIYFENAFGASVIKRGRILPSYDEVRYNASLMLGNSNVASGTSIRLPQNYIAIGGYHIKERIDPLPLHIQTILDAAQNGFIYFSMGSMAKSSSIPKKVKESLLDTFSKLNHTILWKFEEEVADLPENVYMVSWAPQVGVLAHPNCKLFITHGGLLSVMEAIHFGVPIIGIPLFSDQNLNVNRAVKKGFGKKITFSNEIGVHMEAAIKEILYNNRFYKKIKEYSFIYHDRLTPPGELLTHWVSHVVRTKGALHLRSPALLVPWYQKLYFDLAASIIIISFVALKLFIKALNKTVIFNRKLYKSKQKIL